MNGWLERLTSRVTNEHRVFKFFTNDIRPVRVGIPEWVAGNCNSSAVEYGKQLLVVMSTRYARNVDESSMCSGM